MVSESTREDFWLKAATWTFGLWALMLPLTGKLILDSVHELAQEQKAQTQEMKVMAEAINNYRQIDERRMVLLEERQAVLTQRVNSIESHIKLEKPHP